MKNLFTLFFFFLGASAFSQNSNKELNEMHQQMEKNRLSLDSTKSNLDSSIQRANKINDSMDMVRQVESNNRNLTGLVSMMQERDRKERQAMWLRIGFGIAILALGIVGLMRKKKTNTTA